MGTYSSVICWAVQDLTHAEVYCWDSDCISTDASVCAPLFEVFYSPLVLDVAIGVTNANFCGAFLGLNHSELRCWGEPNGPYDNQTLSLPSSYQLISLALSDVYNSICYAALYMNNVLDTTCWNFYTRATNTVVSVQLGGLVNFSASKLLLEIDQVQQRYCFATAVPGALGFGTEISFGCNTFSGATVIPLNSWTLSVAVQRFRLQMTKGGSPILSVSTGIPLQSFVWAFPQFGQRVNSSGLTSVDVDIYQETACYVSTQCLTVNLTCLNLNTGGFYPGASLNQTSLSGTNINFLLAPDGNTYANFLVLRSPRLIFSQWLL